MWQPYDDDTELGAEHHDGDVFWWTAFGFLPFTEPFGSLAALQFPYEVVPQPRDYNSDAVYLVRL